MVDFHGWTSPSVHFAKVAQFSQSAEKALGGESIARHQVIGGKRWNIMSFWDLTFLLNMEQMELERWVWCGVKKAPHFIIQRNIVDR